MCLGSVMVIVIYCNKFLSDLNKWTSKVVQTPKEQRSQTTRMQQQQQILR